MYENDALEQLEAQVRSAQQQAKDRVSAAKLDEAVYDIVRTFGSYETGFEDPVSGLTYSYRSEVGGTTTYIRRGDMTLLHLYYQSRPAYKKVNVFRDGPWVALVTQRHAEARAQIDKKEQDRFMQRRRDALEQLANLQPEDE